MSGNDHHSEKMIVNIMISGEFCIRSHLFYDKGLSQAAIVAPYQSVTFDWSIAGGQLLARGKQKQGAIRLTIV